jgi:hypothetical protein
MKPDTTILVTIHGSHLYGLNHSDSDVDFYRVVASRSSGLHRVTGGIDYVEQGLDRFLGNVFTGSHQACEALFSPVAWVHPNYQPMFRNIRVTGEAAFYKYRRTIHSMSYGPPKMRRHAVRLGFALKDLRKYGRFNPVLSLDQRNKCMVLSQLYRERSLYDIAINL